MDEKEVKTGGDVDLNIPAEGGEAVAGQDASPVKPAFESMPKTPPEETPAA